MAWENGGLCLRDHPPLPVVLIGIGKGGIFFLSDYFASCGCANACPIHLSSFWHARCQNLPLCHLGHGGSSPALSVQYQCRWGSGWLQDPLTGSREVLQPSAYLQTLAMVPIHPEKPTGVCRTLLDPGMPTFSAHPPTPIPPAARALIVSDNMNSMPPGLF